MRAARTRFVASLLALAIGCEIEPMSSSPADTVAGRWAVTGSGTRTECDNRLLLGTFTLASADDLVLGQRPSSDSEGDELFLAHEIAAAFTFGGEVLGMRVSFWTTESYQGEDVSYRFPVF